MRPLQVLLLPPGPELLDRLSAALAGGPAVAPLDPALSAAAQTAAIRRLRPHRIVTVAGESAYDDPAPLLGPDTAVVVRTSGSAGEPKAVELTGAALRASAVASLARLGAAPTARWLCCLPTHHVAGLQVLVRSLVAGSTPEIHPRFDLGPLGTSSAEFVSLVPTMLVRALAAGIDLGRFRAVLLGGAAAPPAVLERATAAGARIVTTYGMSETSGGAVYDGVALAGVGVRVDPGDGRVSLAGPVVASGYRLDPAATAAAFVDGWHRTQDIGRHDADGRLHILGRRDDVVVSGGVNVSLVQVAAALAAHPGVAEAAAVAREDPEWGQQIVAVVVPAGRPPTLAELRDVVAERLEPAAAPRGLLLLDRLPTLPGGKLDRAALADLDGTVPR